MNDDVVVHDTSQSPRGCRVHARAFSLLLSLLQRLTGERSDPVAVLTTLAEELPRVPTGLGRHGIRLVLSDEDVAFLLALYRHQALIDRMAAWGRRTMGPEATYRDCYPEYVRQAQAQGFQPVSLKTFQNRAFRDPVELRAETADAVARHRRKHAA